jgi:hypothetical protein
MPRFKRRPVSIRRAPTSRPPRGSGSVPAADGESIADFTFSILETQVGAYASIKAAAKEVVETNKAPQVVNLVTAIVLAQVGDDEKHSPMLLALVDDLKVDPDEVEIAQDIILAGLDVAKAISESVEAGDPKQVLWKLMGLVGQLIPELEADIKALKN